MRITMIGTGYVGLVSGACFSEFGHEVICVDQDESKINLLNEGRIPIYEPGLESLVLQNKDAKRLYFTTNLKTAVQEAEAIFIAVGTPSRRGDGHADLSYIFKAAQDIAPYLKEKVVVITKSTVPVGTNRQIENVIRKLNSKLQFSVASNPEFLREGSAIQDFMRPDRIVIGIEDEHAQEILSRIYRPLYLIETPIIFTSLETSELSKYAANSFLATKITFMNEMANLCEKLGADIHDIAKVMGLDGRIGKKFLHPSPGFGGSCFPKDLRALISMAEDRHTEMAIIQTVCNVNFARKKEMVQRILQKFPKAEGQKIAILGLTFKPNTDDIRESPSLVIIPELQEKGMIIYAYDPQGMGEASKVLNNVNFLTNPYEVAKGADAVVILTEWNEFRGLDLQRLKKIMKNPILFDFRNIYNPKEAREIGFEYECLGRPFAKPFSDSLTKVA